MIVYLPWQSSEKCASLSPVTNRGLSNGGVLRTTTVGSAMGIQRAASTPRRTTPSGITSIVQEARDPVMSFNAGAPKVVMGESAAATRSCTHTVLRGRGHMALSPQGWRCVTLATTPRAATSSTCFSGRTHRTWQIVPAKGALVLPRTKSLTSCATTAAMHSLLGRAGLSGVVVLAGSVVVVRTTSS